MCCVTEDKVRNREGLFKKRTGLGVAIFAKDFSGRPARKISKNHATANAFGGPDSSCYARFNLTRGGNPYGRPSIEACPELVEGVSIRSFTEKVKQLTGRSCFYTSVKTACHLF